MVAIGRLAVFLGAEFGDGGEDFVFAREFGIFGRVVGGQFGDGDVEGLEEGAGFGQVVATDVRFTVRPSRFVGCNGVAGGMVAVADDEPEGGEVQMRDPLSAGQLLGFAAGVGEFAEMEPREGELGFGRWVDQPDGAGHADGVAEALCGKRPFSAL